MQVTKYETNFKKRITFKKASNILIKEDTKNEENKLINIYPTIEFQEFTGFGGAFTDATCYNLSKCSNDIQDRILDEYFLENEMNYNICRLGIASTDFSKKSYSYSNEIGLSDFSIDEDMEYIIRKN